MVKIYVEMSDDNNLNMPPTAKCKGLQRGEQTKQIDYIYIIRRFVV